MKTPSRHWIVSGCFDRWPIDEHHRGVLHADILPASGRVTRKLAESIAGHLNRAYRLGVAYGRYGTDTPEDTERIIYHCEKAAAYGEQISDACARMIASQYHGGQYSYGYALASTGYMAVKPMPLWRELFGYDSLAGLDARVRDGEVSKRDALIAKRMLSYLLHRWNTDRVDAVEGWSTLWIND